MCQCMCVVFVCVTVFISHLCVAVYCGAPVDHQCVSSVEIFKLTNKIFVTKKASVHVLTMFDLY